jgi:hypothetical protein
VKLIGCTPYSAPTALVNLTRHGNLETVTIRTDFPGTQPRQFLRLNLEVAQP